MSQRHLDRGRRRLTATEVDLGVVHQRALLVGTGFGVDSAEEAEASLDELARLADTAGAEPVAIELQRRKTPHPALYVGKGKAEELRQLAEALDVDVVIFDDELTPAQQRNLEQLFKRDVVDRVALILDIFAQHAASQEGMVQVELAQLRYRLPRLRGRGVTLSQQGGGIGTRGPGETQLEVDRRRIQRRLTKLERDLVGLGRTRATQRKARQRRSLSTVALVGYTNAGKSTLLNRLTDAHVLVEDRLFSTLDPATRPSSWSRSGRRWRRSPTPTSCSTSSTRPTTMSTAGSPRCAACSARSTPARSPSNSCSRSRTRSTPRPSPTSCAR